MSDDPMITRKLLDLSSENENFTRFLFIISIALALNTITLTYQIANPFVRSDGWYFVHDFLMPYYDGTLSIHDLFKIRGPSDHIQPVHRALLIINAELFELDFRYEAIVGVFFLIAIAVFSIRHFFSTHNEFRLNIYTTAGLIAFLFTVFSLNSKMTYNWSLVTLGFMPLFLILLLFVYVSNLITRDKGTFTGLFTLSALTVFTGDNGASLAIITTSLIVLITAVFQRSVRAIKTFLVLILMMVAYHLMRAWLVSMDTIGSDAVQKASEFYSDNLNRLYLVVVKPLSDSLIHNAYLSHLPIDSAAITIIIGVSLLIAHAYYLYAFYRYREYKTSYLPIFLMFYSYALIAGILLYRVPQFGIGYLDSPRYVRAYQIGLWGLVWGYISLYANHYKDNRWQVYLNKALMTAASLMIILQIAIIGIIWNIRDRDITWNREHAANILFYSGDAKNGRSCTDNKKPYPICNMDEEYRSRILSFLKAHELNAFSPRLQRDYLNHH